MDQPTTTSTPILAGPWRTSSYSGHGGNSCVDVQPMSDGGARVRNSNDLDGPVVSFTGAEWTAFRLGMAAGEFDFRPQG